MLCSTAIQADVAGGIHGFAPNTLIHSGRVKKTKVKKNPLMNNKMHASNSRKENLVQLVEISLFRLQVTSFLKSVYLIEIKLNK